MPEQGQMMPPQAPMMPPPPQGWRGRWMQRYGMSMYSSVSSSERTIPNWLTGKAMLFFFISMVACWVAFGHVPGIDLWLAASISILLFFYGGQVMSKAWARAGEKRFLKNVFIAGAIVRLIWVLYMYFIFNPEHYGTTYGDTADVDWYMAFAKDLAQWIVGDSGNTLSQIIDFNGSAIDDVGYPMWLGIGYAIWGELSDILAPMLIKCVVGAYCAISIYRVAKRHFGEGVARMAAIFVCVNPNMIYWCGTMMKEAEMVFVICLAVDNFDRVLTSGKKYTFKALLPGILAGLALMFFRTALGLVFFLAVFAHIVMASRRVMSAGKKILAGILVAAVLAVSMGDRIRTQSHELVEKVQSDTQEKNMKWRSNRKDDEGRQQSFARYASAAVFAPLIFTIPFPTFNQAQASQFLQIQLSGGSYVKNIFSFFVILVMVMMLLSGEWRQHVFILAYTAGYLLMLAMSAFAQSGRFHMPIWPMLMLFAAYGIQIAKRNKKMQRWFTLALVAEVVVCLAWNWFKLKGRGMI